MFTRHTKLAVAVAVALGAPAAAGAQDLGFTYLEGGVVAGFVNDVEEFGTITDNSGTLELETDSGSGGFIGGAWQFWENMHLFGEYALASQDLEVSDGIDTVEGDFDLVRWRIGVGYAYPFSSTMTVGLLRATTETFSFPRSTDSLRPGSCGYLSAADTPNIPR